MQVVSPKKWLPLVAVGSLVAAGLTWSFLGRIPITVAGTGIIVCLSTITSFQSPIALNHGIAEGTRRYLFSSTPVQAMFSTAPSLNGKQHQILAVFLEETELLKVSRAEFNQLFADANREAVAFIEGWILS